jgi:RNA polymerase sigma-70 factor (ECF subfamily)
MIMQDQCLNTGAVWSELSLDLRRYIRRRVRDDHTADDLLQETFVRIHRGLRTLRRRDRLAAWVYRIAGNVLTDFYRQNLENAAPFENEPAITPLRDLRHNAAKWMAELIDQLPERYRDAVRLAEIQQMPQQKIADTLGISLSGAKSRIQRGRRLLKQVLLDCCHFELDRRGRILNCDPRPDRQVCLDCDVSG